MSDELVPQKDIRLMSRQELRTHFGSSSSRRIVVSKLMRASIRQAHAAIVSGAEPPIEGNIRTFWYRWLRPVIARLPRHSQPKSGAYDLMLGVFTQLIMVDKEMSYRDFDFTDENWAHRFLGELRPDVLVFSEKRGWIRFLRRCHEDLGTSALALGGAPSALTSEYTAQTLKQKLGLAPEVTLIGIVDWDPAGAMIASAFKVHLETFGIKVKHMHLLVHPEAFTEIEIEMNRFPVTHGTTKKLSDWMDQGGGIGGEPFGLEIEAIPWERLMFTIESLL